MREGTPLNRPQQLSNYTAQTGSSGTNMLRSTTASSSSSSSSSTAPFPSSGLSSTSSSSPSNVTSGSSTSSTSSSSQPSSSTLPGLVNGTAGAAGGAAGGSAIGSHEGAADRDSAFICNICLEITTKDPVVTQCGHLYCWSCLFRWLNTRHSTCPVCKAGVSNDNIIPLFIKGSEQDPRMKNASQNGSNASDSSVPNRPQGRRPEPVPQTAFGNNGGQMGGMSFSAGFGFFPSLFGLQFQSFTALPPTPSDRPMTPEELEQARLSTIIMGLGVIVILGLFLF